MTLAEMMATDQDAWECDLAETYGILDWEQLSVRKLAMLSAGLRDDSRIKLELSRSKISVDLFLQAVIADKLSWLVWAKTEDAVNNQNKPTSIASLLLGETKLEAPKSKYMQFDSGADFSQRWAELTSNKEETGCQT